MSSERELVWEMLTERDFKYTVNLPAAARWSRYPTLLKSRWEESLDE